MNAKEIFDKYTEALMDLGLNEDASISADAILLALRLAIGDTYAAARSTPATITDRLAEANRAQLDRLNEWLAENEPGQYWTPTDTAEAVLAVLQLHKSELAGLRQQLAQMDADNAGLTERLREAQAEVDRLTRQNVIATDAFNSLAAERHTNGASAGAATGANPTPAPEWNRHHPAWADLPKADLDVIDQLARGRIKSRNLSQTLRRDIVVRAIRHLAGVNGGSLSCSDWDRYRPAWLPTQGAVVMLADDNRWPTLLAMAMALEPATA